MALSFLSSNRACWHSESCVPFLHTVVSLAFVLVLFAHKCTYPVWTSHILIVLSLEAETIWSPLGMMATEETLWSWPKNKIKPSLSGTGGVFTEHASLAGFLILVKSLEQQCMFYGIIFTIKFEGLWILELIAVVVLLSHFSYGFQTHVIKHTQPNQAWSSHCSSGLIPPFLQPCSRSTEGWRKQSFTDLKAVLLSSKCLILKAKVPLSFYFSIIMGCFPHYHA